MKIFKLLDRSPRIVTQTRRVRPEKSEVLKLHASNQKARDRLGWEPTVSLEAGLRRTIEWIAKHLDLYRPDQYTV